MSLGKPSGPVVRCGRPLDIGPRLALGRPQTIHMSDSPGTLGEEACCAPFHRHYYYRELRKTFRDRGWAR